MTLDLSDKRWVGPGKKKKKKKPTPTAKVLSKRKKKVFLETLAKTGKVTHAAQVAGYQDSKYMRAQRLVDEEFAEAWDLASDAAADLMEDEALRRATEGTMEPEFFRGRVVGYKKKYSDALLQFLLKGARPLKYRDNMKIEGQLQGTFGVAVLPMVASSEDEWESKTLDMHNEQQPVDLPPENERPSLLPPPHVKVTAAKEEEESLVPVGISRG